MKTSWVMSAAALGSKSPVVIVGLNSALQKRFCLNPSDTLIPGNVHRASEIQTGVGGKGQDVAIALSCLAYQGCLQLAQFVGSGPEGDAVTDLLRERFDSTGAMRSEDVLSLTVRPKSHMRTCTTIVASDVSTELVEPSGMIEKDEMDELLAKLGEGDRAAGLCIMGSMPPGCPEDTYANIYTQTHGSETLCLIDSVVGLNTLLQAIASSEERGPTLLKLNAAELCRLAGVETNSSSETDGIDPPALIDGISGLLRKFSPYAAVALHGIAVTDGKHPAHFVYLDGNDDFRIFQVPVPTLDSTKILYPIGAGDTVAAGTLSAWKCLVGLQEGGSPAAPCLDDKIQSALKQNIELVQSLSSDDLPLKAYQMVSSFAFGLACGSASCLEEQNSIFQVDDALDLYREMTPSMSLMAVPLDAV